MKFDEKLPEIKKSMDAIYDAVDRQFYRGCGSYLFDGQEYSYYAGMQAKQAALFYAAQKSSNALEIGTYMGHSLAIILAGNPEISITTIDVDSKFASKSVVVLRNLYPKADINFICGESLKVLPTLLERRFDLFHIDGRHEESYIQREIELIKKIRSKITTLILDDIESCPNLVKKIRNDAETKKFEQPISDWTSAVFSIELCEK